MFKEYKLKRIVYGDGRIVYQVREYVEILAYPKTAIFIPPKSNMISSGSDWVYDGYGINDLFESYYKVHYTTTSKILALPHLKRLKQEQIANTVISCEEVI